MATLQKKKRGRPPKGITTVRISPRFPAQVAKSLERASELRGLSVTGFVIESARRAAEAVIEQEDRWLLDQQQTKTLAALLAKPPKPNAAARKAARLAEDVDIRS